MCAALGLAALVPSCAGPPSRPVDPATPQGLSSDQRAPIAVAPIDPDARPAALTAEGALGIREFLAVPAHWLPDVIRIRGFVVRGRSPDIDLADLPLTTESWVHLAGVPKVSPELDLFRYYVFALARRDPDEDEGTATRGFHHLAHAVAEPPKGPSTPTHPDGSWSVGDLLRRTDVKPGDTVRVTAKAVLHTFRCPPCPRNRRCAACRPPFVTFEDEDGGSALSIRHDRSELGQSIEFGKRYVFDFRIDPTVHGGLRYVPSRQSSHSERWSDPDF